MKRNIRNISLVTGLVAAMIFGAGCGTIGPRKASRTHPATPLGHSAAVSVGAQPIQTATNAQPIAPSSGGVVLQIVKAPPVPPTTNGMAGGVAVLFVNKTAETITVFAKADPISKGTFTLELVGNTSRVFMATPGDYEYSWTVGDDSTSYPTASSATLEVADKPIHLYDGIGSKTTERYGAITVFKGK